MLKNKSLVSILLRRIWLQFGRNVSVSCPSLPAVVKQSTTVFKISPAEFCASAIIHVRNYYGPDVFLETRRARSVTQIYRFASVAFRWKRLDHCRQYVTCCCTLGGGGKGQLAYGCLTDGRSVPSRAVQSTENIPQLVQHEETALAFWQSVGTKRKHYLLR